eukprot:3230882-Pyramimonas_sp.AAC.1
MSSGMHSRMWGALFAASWPLPAARIAPDDSRAAFGAAWIAAGAPPRSVSAAATRGRGPPG